MEQKKEWWRADEYIQTLTLGRDQNGNLNTINRPDLGKIVAEATRRGIEQGKREALKDVDDLMDIIAYEENHECQWEELRYRLSALSNLYKE